MSKTLIEASIDKVQPTLDTYKRIVEAYDDDQEPIIDFLADLMHYCSKNGFDFEAFLESARNHFEYESRSVSEVECPMAS